MKLKDKIAIITGAGAGIGKKIATTFAREGARVFIADINHRAAESAATEIRESGGTAIGYRLDVTQELEVNIAIDKAAELLGGIDILVSNAGIQHLDTIADVSFGNWRRILAVHLDGGFLTSRACLRHMYRQGRGGSVILIGSVHSYMASAKKGPYVVAKHGMIGLSRTIAKEGAKYGVRANAICPGLVRTALMERQIPELAKDYGIPEDRVLQEVFLRQTVDGEYTTETDLAETAVFLASFSTNALTGQSVSVCHGSFML